MNIAFCNSFVKQLKKLGSVSKADLKKLLKKYPGSKKIRKIDILDSGTQVLKCYLLGGGVRSLILLRTAQGSYIPVAIVRKETKEGENITKENYQDLFGNDIQKVLSEYKDNQYKIEEL